MIGSRYIVGLLPHTETTNIPKTKTTIFSLLSDLQKEIKHIEKKYSVGHIRAHFGLPGPLHEKNVLTDALTKIIALNLHKMIDKAKNSHKIHHQNAADLRYKFHIPARCVANLWERVCLYFSSGRRFANLDPGAAPHTLLTAPRNLEPKKYVRRVKAGEESAPARCPPDQRGHAGEREMPRAQAAASRSPRPPLLRPPWAPRPTACRVFCLLLLGTLLPRADACSCSGAPTTGVLQYRYSDRAKAVSKKEVDVIQ